MQGVAVSQCSSLETRRSPRSRDCYCRRPEGEGVRAGSPKLPCFVLWEQRRLPETFPRGSASGPSKRLFPSGSGPVRRGEAGRPPCVLGLLLRSGNLGPGMETPRPAFSLFPFAGAPQTPSRRSGSAPAVFAPLCTPQWVSQDPTSGPPRRHPGPMGSADAGLPRSKAHLHPEAAQALAPAWRGAQARVTFLAGLVVCNARITFTRERRKRPTDRNKHINSTITSLSTVPGALRPRGGARGGQGFAAPRPAQGARPPLPLGHCILSPGLRFPSPVSGGSGNSPASQNAHRRRRQAEPLGARGSPLPGPPKPAPASGAPRPALSRAPPGRGHRALGTHPGRPRPPPSRGDKVTPCARTRRDSPRGPPGPGAPSAPRGSGARAGRAGSAARGARGRPPGGGTRARAPRASPCGRPRGESGGGGGRRRATAPLRAVPPRPALPAPHRPARWARRQPRGAGDPCTSAPTPSPRPRGARLPDTGRCGPGLASLGRRAVPGSAPAPGAGG